MPKFYVEAVRANDAASQLSSVMKELTNAKSGVSSVAASLNGDTQLMANIRTKLSRASSDITQLIFSVNTLRFGLNSAMEMYENAESRICGNAAGTSNTKGGDRFNDIPDILSPEGITLDDPRLDGGEDGPQVNPLAELLKKVKSLLEIIEKYSGNEYVGPFASAFGIISAFTNMIDPNSTYSPKTLISNLFNLGEDSLAAVGGIAKWFEKNKMGKIFSAVGSIAGIAGDITDLSGMSGSDVLKNSGNLLPDITRLADDITSAGTDLSKSGAASKNIFIAALTAAASMTAFAFGDVYQRATDDGVYDLDDYSDTLLRTGINGADTFLTAATFGLVDFDAESAVKTFEDNTGKVTQMIKDTGAPTWAQVVMTVPAAAGVVVVSGAEVIVDYGESLVDAIKSIIALFK